MIHHHSYGVGPCDDQILFFSTGDYDDNSDAINHCDHHAFLRSSIGLGPKGDSIGVKVAENDPYGYYRLQFYNESTNEVLLTTQNLDPGSRIYVCDIPQYVPEDEFIHTVMTSAFTTLQPRPINGPINEARIGDLVIYRMVKLVSADNDRPHYFLGIGAITDISDGLITFVDIAIFDTTMTISTMSVTADKLDVTIQYNVDNSGDLTIALV